jgi:MFS family permease
MARWALAGSIGVVAGPLILAVVGVVGFGWRGLFFGFAGMTGVLLGLVSCFPNHAEHTQENSVELGIGFAEIVRALKNSSILRWLVLLQFADLILTYLFCYKREPCL